MTGCRHNAKNTLVKNYLYLAEQRRRRGPPADDGDGGAPAARRRLRRRRPGRTNRPVAPARGGRTFTAEQVVFAASALGTQKLLHRMRDKGVAAAPLRRASASSPAPTPSRSSARSRPTPRRRLQPGHRDHVVVPPRRAHPHRAGPLRQGQQRDVAACRPCSPTATGRAAVAQPGCREMWREKRQRADALRRPALVGAHGRSRWSCRPWTTPSPRSPSAAGHRPAAAHLTAGPRRSQPVWIPAAQRGRPAHGRGHRRHAPAARSASRSTCR